MDDVARLVKNLYNPAFSREVVLIQKQLQDLQKSEHGWRVADELLEHDDFDLKFFGALTITVKINQDGHLLPDDALLELRQKLVSWIVRFTPKQEYSLVIRKLCTALVTYFNLTNVTWQGVIWYLACCLAGVPGNAKDNAVSGGLILQILPNLDERQLLTILTFADTLAAEGRKVEQNGHKFGSVHKRIRAEIYDAVRLMIFNLTERVRELVVDETILAYEDWIQYTLQTSDRGSDLYEQLQSMFGPILGVLDTGTSYEKIARFLIEAFNEYTDLVNGGARAEFRNYINSPASLERLKLLEQDGELGDDEVVYGEVVMAFCTMEVFEIACNPRNQTVLQDLVHYMTKLEALRDEPNLSNAVVDFWEQFALELGSLDADSDEEGDSGTADVFLTGKRHCLAAVKELCSIMGRSPSDEQADGALSELRIRVVNLVEEALPDFMPEILDDLLVLAVGSYESIRTTQTSTSSQARTESMWRAVDASLTLISSLSFDSKDPSANLEAKVKQFFQSNIFKDTLQLTSSTIPSNVRKMMVRVVSRLCTVALRAENINYCLELLFKCLQEPDLMQTAARAIYRICDRGRRFTAERILDLIQATEGFFTAVNDEESRSNIVGATACSAQALSLHSPQAQVAHLTTLLNIVDKDFERKVAVAAGNPDHAREAAIVAVQLIEKIAKGSEEPADEVIDVDSDENKRSSLPYWQGEGRGLQQQIFAFINKVLQVSQQDGLVLDTSCEVVQSGYLERNGGPFAFPASVTVDLVGSVPADHPRVDVVMSLASAFVTTHLSPQFKDVTSVAALVKHAISLIGGLQDPQANPDLSAPCMELFNRLIPKYMEVLQSLPGPALSVMMDFTLRCLELPDLLPKKASSMFWDSLLASSQREPSTAFVNQLCREVGPRLSQILIFAVGAHAARGQLELFINPLRKLASSQPGAKAWIEAALFHVDFPSNRVSEAEKRRLLAQIISLRGSAKTNSIVKQFWTASKGVPVSYS